MTVKINLKGYDHARSLIDAGHAVLDERGDWSDHRPSAQQEDALIEERGLAEFVKWRLGVDHEKGEHGKERYRFPYGDFRDVHRCAVLAAEARRHYKHVDIELAAHLHGMPDAVAHLGRFACQSLGYELSPCQIDGRQGDRCSHRRKVKTRLPDYRRGGRRVQSESSGNVHPRRNPSDPTYPTRRYNEVRHGNQARR